MPGGFLPSLGILDVRVFFLVKIYFSNCLYVKQINNLFYMFIILIRINIFLTVLKPRIVIKYWWRFALLYQLAKIFNTNVHALVQINFVPNTK